jgi:hypothetical protein
LKGKEADFKRIRQFGRARRAADHCSGDFVCRGFQSIILFKSKVRNLCLVQPYRGGLTAAAVPMICYSMSGNMAGGRISINGIPTLGQLLLKHLILPE